MPTEDTAFLDYLAHYVNEGSLIGQQRKKEAVSQKKVKVYRNVAVKVASVGFCYFYYGVADERSDGLCWMDVLGLEGWMDGWTYAGTDDHKITLKISFRQQFVFFRLFFGGFQKCCLQQPYLLKRDLLPAFYYFPLTLFFCV